jgi:hypothetical protein
MQNPALLLLAVGVMAVGVTAGGVMTAAPALAQTSNAQERVRVVGAIEKLDGDRLSVDMGGGRTEVVTLSPDAQIFGVEKRRLDDVKPGDFVASGGVRGSDGKIHAVEMRIFPEALRGIGEGQRPWDAKPEGVMTNATVGTVTQTTDGGVVHVTYKGGQSEYLVAPEVPVLAYVLADKTLLKPGAAVTTVALKQTDGSLRTSRLTAEKDGVKPPM